MYYFWGWKCHICTVEIYIYIYITKIVQNWKLESLIILPLRNNQLVRIHSHTHTHTRTPLLLALKVYCYIFLQEMWLFRTPEYFYYSHEKHCNNLCINFKPSKFRPILQKTLLLRLLYAPGCIYITKGHVKKDRDLSGSKQTQHYPWVTRYGFP